MTAETIGQSLLSGLLTGLIYALVAVGLSLIFGLMDVVNFAHGEFLMTAMYATLGFTLVLAIDPIISAPLVAALLFVFGALVYAGIIRFAMRARTNAGMVQIFSTFGLGILLRGLAQFFFTPDYRSIQRRPLFACAAGRRRAGVRGSLRGPVPPYQAHRLRQGARSNP
jgi:branched-chain amino acid transport system permease protein